MSEDIKKKGFPFKIDGVAGESPDQKVTASYLIKYAIEKGIPAAKESPESITLKGLRGSYSGDDVIDLSKDHDFTIEVKKENGTYFFEVGDKKLQSEQKILKAQEIIDMARNAGLYVPEKPILRAVGDNKRKFEADEQVDLSQYHKFTISLGGSTPVA